MATDEKENLVAVAMESQKVEEGAEQEKKDLAESIKKKEEKENDDEEPQRDDEKKDEDNKDNNTKTEDSNDEPSSTSNDNPENKSAPEKRHTSSTSPAVVPLTRPAKRARTAYFIFAEEKRAEVQKDHEGEGVVGVARALGHLWASMNDEEKRTYQERAAEERTRLAEELEAWKAAGGVVEDEKNSAASKSGGGASSTILPVARIRKICKLDPEVRGLSKEAVMLVTKAAELATSKLGTETVRVAQIQNRRKLLPEDVAQVCSSREQFLFLREDVADLVKLQQKESTAAAASNSKNEKKKPVVDETGPKMKPLTAYFAAN